MKKIAVIFVSFIYTVLLTAQTQYDYYDDDVAHQKPVIDGYGLLGLVLLAIIGFVVWIVFSSIKEWANKHIDTTPRYKEPKPKTAYEIRKEEAERERTNAENLKNWNAVKEEALQIIQTEYQTPYKFDNVNFVFKPETLKQDTIDAFTRGYYYGVTRAFTHNSEEKIKKTFHIVVRLGYERGLKAPERRMGYSSAFMPSTPILIG